MCPEVPGRCAPGKNRSKKKGLFTAVGSTFPTRGVLKSLEGKRACPEVPGGLRNEAATRKLEPPKPANTKTNRQSTFGPFWLASVHEKPPQRATRPILPLKGLHKPGPSRIHYSLCWLKFFQDTLPCHLQVPNVQKPWPSQSCRRLASPLAQVFCLLPVYPACLKLETPQEAPENNILSWHKKHCMSLLLIWTYQFTFRR